MEWFPGTLIYSPFLFLFVGFWGRKKGPTTDRGIRAGKEGSKKTKISWFVLRNRNYWLEPGCIFDFGCGGGYSWIFLISTDYWDEIGSTSFLDKHTTELNIEERLDRMMCSDAVCPSIGI